MLEEKLRDYKAENHLLGRILQDFKEERGSVENQLEEAKRSEQVHRMKVDQLASDLGMVSFAVFFFKEELFLKFFGFVQISYVQTMYDP